MAGNDRRGMVIQERDRHLLRELATLRVIDRDLAKTVGGFTSISRVNRRLRRLVDAGLLRRFFLGSQAGGARALYTLSPKGAALAGVPLHGPRRLRDERVYADFAVQHQLAINALSCALKYQPLPPGIALLRWISFHEHLGPATRLIPDGYLELATPHGTEAAFLEVDLGHERGPVWRQKVEEYLRFGLSGEHRRLFGQDRFLVLVVTTTDRRLAALRTLVARSTRKIFRFTTFGAIERAGFFAPIWFRPGGEGPEAILEETPPSP